MRYELEHHYIWTNGVTLHVVQCGPKEGPLVILLHGFPDFWYGWRHQIEPLAAAGYRVWVPDQRGYNLSDKPSRIREYTLPTLAHDIVGLIDAAGREQASLIGHDWGGIVTWYLATYHETRILNASVLNVPHPAVLPSAFLRIPDQVVRSWYMFFFQLPWLPEQFMLNNLGLLTSTSHRGAFRQADLQRYRAAWMRPNAMRGMINWYRAFRYTLGNKDKEPRVTTPVQLIWGKQDVTLNAKLAELSFKLCENGELHYFPDATHWVQLEKPTEVNELLIKFLQAKERAKAY
ncbi:alpha/beta hydrolase [Hymenobacter sp. GOD-10R]|uniref:alpha/beta fold hydrolase n=1 Tax=Hymenobacter sp. GOD-10R TaxID=3093922 RepID=UPI002D7A098E|nr:alpha/beta hydrolase [Hymenobacter sp. GOD-10R]WRQ27578.1 alpha/beta hydrolase [Hymenobacter sp. GOD-10R]